MVIDVHGHLGNINIAPFWSADGRMLEDYCDRAGVDLMCVSSAKSLQYDVSEGNRDLLETLRETTRLLGYVVVNPIFPETAADLRLLDEDQKFRGVKIHADYHGYDLASREVIRFLDVVAEKARVMLFHVSCMPGTGFAAAGKIGKFAKRHPETTFILAHLAGIFQNDHYPYFPNFAGLEEIAGMGLKNVYIDTAHYLMYVYPGVMETMVRLVGSERIVFGTDAPLQGPLQMEFAIRTIRALPIPEDQKEQILCGNAREILGI